MNFQEFLDEHGRPMAMESGDHVFRQGENDRSMYAITSGILKAYYLSEDGKENIKSFVEPNAVIGSLTATFSKEACSFSLICLEPCCLLKLPFETLYTESQNNLEIANTVNRMLLQLSMKKERREFELLCLSAEQRYRRFIEGSPHMMDRLTQNDIARYLGITPVALSRIKKRISSGHTDNSGNS